MNEKLLHTPEGVRDIYDAECKKKKKVISQIHHVLELYSYQDIDTPSFEYFDIFNMDKGLRLRTKCINSLTATITLWCYARISHRVLPGAWQSIIRKNSFRSACVMQEIHF